MLKVLYTTFTSIYKSISKVFLCFVGNIHIHSYSDRYIEELLGVSILPMNTHLVISRSHTLQHNCAGCRITTCLCLFECGEERGALEKTTFTVLKEEKLMVSVRVSSHLRAAFNVPDVFALLWVWVEGDDPGLSSSSSNEKTGRSHCSCDDIYIVLCKSYFICCYNKSVHDLHVNMHRNTASIILIQFPCIL